jgi:predicted metal-dependent hydrolase
MLQLTLDFFGRQLDRFKPVPLPRPPGRRIDRALEWKHGLTVNLVFHPRARRYLLGLRPDGAARLVIPRRGTEAEGLRFLERSEPWLFKQLAKWRGRSHIREAWGDGARFLFRGEETVLRVEKGEGDFHLRFAEEIISVAHEKADYRDVIQCHLRQIAERELPMRTRELALVHGIAIQRVSVRAQKTRWGSCSARGTISLNWRLIQAPPFVVDYLIIHELMHRREMNHSARYWKLVAQAFPDYKRAEMWLKKSGIDLRGL